MQQIRGKTEQRLVMGDKFRAWWDEKKGMIRNRSQGDKGADDYIVKKNMFEERYQREDTR